MEEKEKLGNQKINENDLNNVAGGYTPYFYNEGSYLALNKKEYDFLKKKGYINKNDMIDSNRREDAITCLRDNKFYRDIEIGQKQGDINIIIDTTE